MTKPSKNKCPRDRAQEMILMIRPWTMHCIANSHHSNPLEHFPLPCNTPQTSATTSNRLPNGPNPAEEIGDSSTARPNDLHRHHRPVNRVTAVDRPCDVAVSTRSTLHLAPDDRPLGCPRRGRHRRPAPWGGVDAIDPQPWDGSTPSTRPKNPPRAPPRP